MPLKYTLQTIDECPECGGGILPDYKAGEEVCTDCGLVVRNTILDAGPEWRAFTQEEKDKRQRVGAGERPSRRITGSTFYEREGRMTPEQMREWRKRKRLHTISNLQDSKDRNLGQAMAELNRLSDALGNIPPYCKDDAAVIYRKALDKGLVRGRSIDAIMDASLYAAIRRGRVPRTLREVTKKSHRPHKEVARSYRLLLRKLKLRMPVPGAEYNIPKIVGKLKEFGRPIRGETERRANMILKMAKERRITAGKDPMGMAAAALYIAFGKGKEATQGELAKAAGVTEVTIRNRYKGLKEGLGEELDNLLLGNMPIGQTVEAYSS